MNFPLRQGCHADAKFVYQFLFRRAKHATMKTSSAARLGWPLFLAAAQSSWARPPTEADFLAGTITADEIGQFFRWA